MKIKKYAQVLGGFILALSFVVYFAWLLDLVALVTMR